jgi:hypothetical protein
MVGLNHRRHQLDLVARCHGRVKTRPSVGTPPRFDATASERSRSQSRRR